MLVLANITVNQTTNLLGRGYDSVVGMLITPLLKVSPIEVSATNIPWAADNGAFSGFDAEKFQLFLKGIADQPNCLFVVCPDVVSNARETLEMFAQWRGEIEYINQPVAFALQDGQDDLELPEADAYFVGGSTKFKLSTSADDLIAEGKRRGKWIHMGRVNTKRRIRHAHKRCIDSIDGTCMRFAGFGALIIMCEYVDMLNTYERIKNANKASQRQEPR